MYQKDRLEFNTNFICSLVLLYLQKSIAKSHLQKKNRKNFKIKKKQKKHAQLCEWSDNTSKGNRRHLRKSTKASLTKWRISFFYDLITKECHRGAHYRALGLETRRALPRFWALNVKIIYIIWKEPLLVNLNICNHKAERDAYQIVKNLFIEGKLIVEKRKIRVNTSEMKFTNTFNHIWKHKFLTFAKTPKLRLLLYHI